MIKQTTFFYEFSKYSGPSLYRSSPFTALQMGFFVCAKYCFFTPGVLCLCPSVQTDFCCPVSHTGAVDGRNQSGQTEEEFHVVIMMEGF